MRRRCQLLLKTSKRAGCEQEPYMGETWMHRGLCVQEDAYLAGCLPDFISNAGQRVCVRQSAVHKASLLRDGTRRRFCAIGFLNGAVAPGVKCVL